VGLCVKRVQEVATKQANALDCLHLKLCFCFVLLTKLAPNAPFLFNFAQFPLLESNKIIEQKLVPRWDICIESICQKKLHLPKIPLYLPKI
jgi:hypothetical protein